MSTFATTHNTTEAMLVALGTFLVALTIMGSFGGLNAIELWLAFAEAIAGFVLWTRFVQRPATRRAAA